MAKPPQPATQLVSAPNNETILNEHHQYASLLSAFTPPQQQEIICTLTRQRLSKYLQVTQGDEQLALTLYLHNAKLSAAFLTDLHFVEVALRNKFDAQLSLGFGTQLWFASPSFTSLLDPRTLDILQKAQRDAAKGRKSAASSGQVITELMFGFWLNLTDRKLEHALWVPILHKAFLPNKPPKRAQFNLSLEKLRQLRNRVAHHEPIFQLPLSALHTSLHAIAHTLCPASAQLLQRSSHVARQISALTQIFQPRLH
jgi:hypothetical protein